MMELLTPSHRLHIRLSVTARYSICEIINLFFAKSLSIQSKRDSSKDQRMKIGRNSLANPALIHTRVLWHQPNPPSPSRFPIFFSPPVESSKLQKCPNAAEEMCWLLEGNEVGADSWSRDRTATVAKEAHSSKGEIGWPATKATIPLKRLS